MTEYAVYNENAMVDNIYDNDMMDWFTDYDAAYDAAKVRKEAEERLYGDFLEWLKNELPEIWEKIEAKTKTREEREKETFGEFLYDIDKKEFESEKENSELQSIQSDYIEYIGKTYGGLTVIGVVEDRRPRINTRVSCICVHCGQTVTRTLAALKNNPISCGCVKKEHRKNLGVIIKTCPVCGKEFEGKRSCYCPECRTERCRKYNTEYQRNKRRQARNESEDV